MGKHSKKTDPRKTRAVDYLRSGRAAEAGALLRAMCDNDGSDPEAWFLLGVIQGQAGHIEEVVHCCRRAVVLRPPYPEAHYNLGQAYLHLRRLEEAATSYREALRYKPDYAEACNHLGYALMEMGRQPDALEWLDRAVHLRPDYAEAHANLGAVRLAVGELTGAASSLGTALQLHPGYAKAHYNLGLVRRAQGDFRAAAECFRKAVHEHPGYAEAHNNLGSTLTDFGDYDEAERHFRSAVLLRADFTEARNNLANTLMSLGRLDEAFAQYREVRRQRPEDLDALAGEADVLEKHRRHREAFDLLWSPVRSGIEHPGVAVGFSTLCSRFDRCAEAIALLDRLLQHPEISAEARLQVRFALGRLHDRNGDYDRAFAHYQAGNALKPVQVTPDHPLAEVNALIRTFAKDALERLPHGRKRADHLVFIVGMPRSGTSLVEQILASHPNVFGAGERRDLQTLVATLPASLNGIPYPECAARLTQKRVDLLARRYLEPLTRLAPDAARVTDKMPHNFLHLGLIEILFPGARIIHCVRDPLDTCLSCYFQNFGGYHPYAYDLASLGRYYHHYQRLMAHWRAVLSLPVMEVRYEELVEHQEEVSREMVAFCGLDWDADCLRFYESSRLVNTASYDQVRRPVYRGSMGRWRHYETHLAPLQAALWAAAESTPPRKELAPHAGDDHAGGSYRHGSAT